MKTALITGASAGLGAEFARQLAQEQWQLVLVARRKDKLEALAAEITAAYEVPAQTLAADLSSPLAPAMIEAWLAERNLAVDYLINNAGSGGPDLIDDQDWPTQQQYLQLMLMSVSELCHRLIPGMRQRGFGRVINVASVAGRIIRPGDTNYGPTKAYLIALSESLQHLQNEGVHVCALCPGFTHTDFHAAGELAEMKAGLPKFLWYDAAVVVAEGRRAVERGKPICISGRLYRWIDPFFQSKLTRWLLLKLA